MIKRIIFINLLVLVFKISLFAFEESIVDSFFEAINDETGRQIVIVSDFENNYGTNYNWLVKEITERFINYFSSLTNTYLFKMTTVMDIINFIENSDAKTKDLIIAKIYEMIKRAYIVKGTISSSNQYAVFSSAIVNIDKDFAVNFNESVILYSYKTFQIGIIYKTANYLISYINKWNKYNESETYYVKAMELYENNDLNGAFEMINRALNIDSYKQKYYMLRAKIWTLQKKYQNAINDYETVLRLEPNKAEAYNEKGKIYYELSDYNRALSEFNSAITIKPDYALAYYNRAVLFLKRKKYDFSLEDINKALTLDKQMVDGYITRGIIYLERNLLDKAIIDFNTAIDLDPLKNYAYFFRAKALYQAGYYNNALQDINIFLENDPYNNEAIVLKGLILIENKDYVAALSVFDRAYRMNYRYADNYLGLAISSFKMGNYEDAKRYYRKVLELDVRYYNRLDELEENGKVYQREVKNVLRELNKLL